MGDAWLRLEVLSIRTSRRGMRRGGGASTPTKGTSDRCMRWRGRLMAHVLPLAEKIGRSRCGREDSKTGGSSMANCLWDEASTTGDVGLETDGSGATQASYVLGDDEVLAQTRSGTTNYYLDDGQGSVRDLTNSSGAITGSYTYDAFGNLLS